MKSLEAWWDDYRRNCLPATFTEQQVDAFRNAFIAGVLAASRQPNPGNIDGDIEAWMGTLILIRNHREVA